MNNNVKFVDLDLPSGMKWADRNVGASSPEEYGDYFTYSESLEYNTPSKQDWEELLTKCTWTWTNQGGHNGYKVTGPNGNSIFLPAAGWRGEVLLDDAEVFGYYWSSALYKNSTKFAFNLYLFSGNHGIGWSCNNERLSVRPILNF